MCEARGKSGRKAARWWDRKHQGAGRRARRQAGSTSRPSLQPPLAPPPRPAPARRAERGRRPPKWCPTRAQRAKARPKGSMKTLQQRGRCGRQAGRRGGTSPIMLSCERQPRRSTRAQMSACWSCTSPDTLPRRNWAACHGTMAVPGLDVVENPGGGKRQFRVGQQACRGGQLETLHRPTQCGLHVVFTNLSCCEQCTCQQQHKAMSRISTLLELPKPSALPASPPHLQAA